MYPANITTNDYDNNTDLNTTNVYNNCTNNENNIEKIIPTLFLTIPCGLSILCLMSSLLYTLTKPSIKFK